MWINIDEIATGVLVNAISAAGRLIASSVGNRYDRRGTHEIAHLYDTKGVIKKVPNLPDMTPAIAAQIAAILGGDEIQAALQEIFAARLVDARYAGPAFEAFRQTFVSSDPALSIYARPLAEFFDKEFRVIIAQLQIRGPSILAQVRNEAASARMIYILHAIERHTAALKARPRSEEAFLASYRRHVADQHGNLEPPDFDRRRRIPVADIYVPTIIREYPSPQSNSINIYGLAGLLDRSVLLGDPGGGKTTAANVLMHHFASSNGKVPFLVTLRDFAAKNPPERSVIGHLEHILSTFYQCPPPPGLIDLLMLTGRAVVIFDGLDELLDTSTRAEVSSRVERFCTEYPVAPVLVTSRLVGYDQARLDDRQFSCYRLDGFDDEQVAEYVRKWFALDEGTRPGDTDAFMAESAGVIDLRSNPLLLSLMCILYRGAWSLPQDRVETYEKCADLLIRNWDAYRRIYHDLRAARQVKPALRHLAWWLFTRHDHQVIVSERELIDETTAFLQVNGFASQDDARDAASEFVGFCRGRMWIFSDAGTTRSGERLYQFTHRTFLEYFAAAHVAYDNDDAKDLAGSLVTHIARNEWLVLAELAIQIKSGTSNRGAQRFYASLLEDIDRWNDEERANILCFLARCLQSVDPSSRYVRELWQKILGNIFDYYQARDLVNGVAANMSSGLLPAAYDVAICDMLSNCGSYADVLAAEVAATVRTTLGVGDRVALIISLWFVASLPGAYDLRSRAPSEEGSKFWASLSDDIIRAHSAAVIAASQTNYYLRQVALEKEIVTVGQALEMRGGLSCLITDSYSFFADIAFVPYLAGVCSALIAGWPAFSNSEVVQILSAVGSHLIAHPDAPWFNGRLALRAETLRSSLPTECLNAELGFGEATWLGAAAILAILAEQGQLRGAVQDLELGPLQSFGPYLTRRLVRPTELPELPVGDLFRRKFIRWAEGKEDFSLT